ncbi:Fe-S cluster assembly protein SufD [Saccharospirillum mangrovi]|uniref:Fe-S cluster assembly protein SufD n=1 Tax=Saccharospirillum mangrovi TaxID=2161747 RepID=UPI0018E54804|nr:Fe-S cluster assembly protein SufD [Saccharospirillum mangrovi]
MAAVPMQAHNAYQQIQAASDWPWLSDWRARGWEQFSNTPWPTRKTEDWKYTPLRSLTETDWQLASEKTNAQGVEFGDWSPTTLTLVNGQVVAQDALPAGVSVRLLSQADAQARAQFEQRLTQTLAGERQLFNVFNQAMLTEAVWIEVAPGTVLEKPLHLNQVISSAAAERMIPVRVLCDLGERAEATLVETFTNEATGAVFTNPVTELQLAGNARLRHYHLLLEEGDVRHLGSVHASLGGYASLDSFHMALGGTLKRKDIVVEHNGSGAELTLNGVYLPRGQEHIDYHTTLEHCVPHCTSQEVFRGIIADKAKAVFNGRIHIHKDAQKTLAELSNKNLLTSHQAEVDTKPELEIYADDVKCAHGATVAQRDDSALFYFLARGISKAEAEVMLNFAFINELLDGLADDAVRDLLQPLLRARFARGESLESLA